MSKQNIPFNKPYMTGKELSNIAEAHFNGILSGNGPFTKHCQQWLTKQTDCKTALLTHSCTAALEMTAILANIQPGDEIIMPSYTFVSTANAFVLRGGVPVFVDVREDTLNIDENKIEAAITEKTKAIIPVHYAGVACEMDSIMEIAHKHNLIVIEDAAQAIMSTYKGKPLGSIGDMGCLSFHETKNIISGEGGALLINKQTLIDRAEIIWEKGTDRSQFFRGQTDKYTWQDIGSSFLPGEITAAFLWAQMQEATNITKQRLDIWNTYHIGFKKLENTKKVRRPLIPKECLHNAHMYYLLLENKEQRDRLIHELNKLGINCVFHYIPLHNSPVGLRYLTPNSNLSITENTANRILRLPLWCGLENHQKLIIDSIIKIIDS